MQDIDEMDILGFLRVRAWNVARKRAQKAPQHRYIDEVWPDMKSR